MTFLFENTRGGGNVGGFLEKRLGRKVSRWAVALGGLALAGCVGTQDTKNLADADLKRLAEQYKVSVDFLRKNCGTQVLNTIGAWQRLNETESVFKNDSYPFDWRLATGSPEKYQEAWAVLNKTNSLLAYQLQALRQQWILANAPYVKANSELARCVRSVLYPSEEF